MPDMSPDPFTGQAAPVVSSPAGPTPGHFLSIEFTGSGSEYFRIWIVNLLLLVVTVGIYYPWAKVRRLRYFHGNTLVAGAPLDFHGLPWKMLKGYLLVGLLFGLYSWAGQFSALGGLVAFLIVAAVWPALLKSAMQFRLANTSWRGLRFRFKGSLANAYRATLPIFAPGVFFVAANVGLTDPEQPPLWYLFLAGGATLVTLAVAPWLMWNFKRFQHDHYALASLQTTFVATRGSFYGLFFKTLGMLALPLVALGVLAALAAYSYKHGDGSAFPGWMAALGFLSVLAFLVIAVSAMTYLTARLQNLVWNGTSNASIRFRSALRFRSLLWLTVKNWLLVICTLGLYWPFAAVATARLRLQAVQAQTREGPETLISQSRADEGDAAGEAGGDLFGFDIGL
jgi:uncharacterized membrane protein YjgN (DUF898 family)